MFRNEYNINNIVDLRSNLIKKYMLLPEWRLCGAYGRDWN